MTPIFQTSTYVQDAPGQHKGYEYARSQNPTRAALEVNLAALENGVGAVCFSSGLAAMDAILKMLKPGDEVIATNDLYGGSYRLMTKLFSKYGIKMLFIDMQQAENIKDSITERTKLIWLETPTNPMLNIVDIKAICDITNSKGVWTCVDNTFASPYLQNPLDLGATMVMHSATKYLGGHSDVIHGCVITSDTDVHKELKFIQNAAGAVPGPQDCFLILRGIKTLHIRVERACQNAESIARFLKSHEKVSKVYWPGFEDHPNHEKNNVEAANKVLSNTHYFSLAESLGGVESLIGHPATMTHASIPKEDRLRVGLTDSLIRLSVGIEDIADLKADLNQALEAV
ncbi:UNVERIFIED_CONTAM: hypothetical protein GTU68_032961 [Idotea baltica]|nr:hypothetical protein [Idotea baltica]